jgi:hypothetical protein
VQLRAKGTIIAILLEHTGGNFRWLIESVPSCLYRNMKIMLKRAQILENHEIRTMKVDNRAETMGKKTAR